MRRAIIASSLLLCCLPDASAQAGGRALRGLCAQGDPNGPSRTIWAVGDDELILRSEDNGTTWHVCRGDSSGAVGTGTDAARKGEPASAPGTTAPAAGRGSASFQAAWADGRAVYFFGGRAVSGHPGGAGVGVILRTEDGGRTLSPVPPGPAGWLYGGVFSGDLGAVFGEARSIIPGGLVQTTSGGKAWKPVELSSTGYLLGSDFRTFRYGYVVGRQLRVVSLRNLGEPRIHPQELSGRLDLRAARFADEEQCWAVGENGIILRSRPTGRPWTPMSAPLPRGTARCADFEAIAFGPDGQAWIAGGLLGVIPHTADGGQSWNLLPAPEAGAIHALECLDKDTLLAAGDGGRIWRSQDGGKRWKLVRGTEQTDVLFVLSAADKSLYPAIAAHSLAGCSVAVVFATVPADDGGAPPDQPLRAAAIRAGAGAVLALGDFTSQAVLPHAQSLTEKDVLGAWSAHLDSPAEEEMLRQLAAAIRLYRPAVLAVGPDAAGTAGPRAECRLVARLAQAAAELAAREDALKELAQAGLKPWKVQRVFVGLQTNEQWRLPWEPPDSLDRKELTTLIDTAAFPAGESTSLEMIALEAIWRLPWFDLPDRPGRYSAYKCRTESSFRPLFTSGLTGARLGAEPVDDERRSLSAAATLRAAAAGRIATVLPQLLDAARKASDDPLPADRLILAWTRLLEEGRLAQAAEARDAFLQFGRRHPMFERISVVTLASMISAEWRAQLASQEPSRLEKGLDLALAAKRYADMGPWSTTDDGLMLLAKVLLASGRKADAIEVLKKLAAEPYHPAWRNRADLELSLLAPARDAKYVPEKLTAWTVNEAGKIDGLLTEQCWQKVPPTPLVGRDGNQPPETKGASVQAIRTPFNVVLAFRLPLAGPEGRGGFAPQRSWKIDLAIDADRDTWTQLLLSFDTQGGQSGRLIQRYGPAATVPVKPSPAEGKQGFLVAVRKTETECTVEAVIPISQVGGDPKAAGLWNFQVRAEARDGDKTTRLYLVPQEDDRLLPERYGLLQIGD